MRAHALGSPESSSINASQHPASRRFVIVFSSIVRLGVLLVLEGIAIAYVDSPMMYIAYID